MVSIEESPSFADLASWGHRVVFYCMVGTPHYAGGNLHLTPEEGAARFGPDAKVEAIRRRLRCKGCGHRGPRILVDFYEPMSPALRAQWSSHSRPD